MTTDATGSEKSANSDDQKDQTDDSAIVQKESRTAPLPLLNGAAELDLSGLPEEQRQALIADYMKGLIDVDKRAKEIGVDVLALERTLSVMGESAQAVSSSNNAVTITNALENSLGRTEIIMGNTEHAMKGKLSQRQAGRRDMQPYLVGLGIAGVIVLGIVIARG